MGYWLDPQGNYYEGDPRPNWVAVPQRPDANHFWEGTPPAWTLDMPKAHGKLGYLPVEDMISRVFPVPSALPDPSTAPTYTIYTTGGNVGPGTYLVAYSMDNQIGQTLVSPTTSVTVTSGTTNLLELTIPATPVNTGLHLYCSEAGGTVLYDAGEVYPPDGETSLTSGDITTIPTTTASQPVTTNGAVAGPANWDWVRFNSICTASPGVATGAPRGGRMFGDKAMVEGLAQWLLYYSAQGTPVTTPGVGSVISQMEYNRLINMLAEYNVQ